jgi:sugar lactone lactonase YvrE
VTDVREGIQVEPVGDVTAILGEGPYWVPSESVLLWVDPPRGLLHHTKIPSGATTTDDLGEVSAAFPVHGGGVLYAGGLRLVHREHKGGDQDLYTERILATAPDRESTRFNDASVDPAGRVWVGTMHVEEADPRGELYRLDAGRELTVVATGVTISNGIGWSPDGSRLYYVDSPTKRIDVFDYDAATGEATRRRVFADLSGFSGVPDGLTVDLDGYVWVAMFAGGVLRRFAPSGDRDAIVPLPVTYPTSVAFGGAGLSDLYVTTSRRDLSPSEAEAEPLAGRLLTLRPGPAGLPSTHTHAMIPA